MTNGGRLAVDTAKSDAITDVEQVWREFGDQLRAFVRRRISDSDRADDIVSEVLLRVHSKLHTVQDPERLPAWIFQIARNAITDEYRRGARREVPLDFDVVDPDAQSFAADSVDDQDAMLRELAMCMRPLLGGLSADYRRALELTDLGGATQTEAARREGISISGMKSRVQRGRRQLARLLEQCCTLTLDARGMPAGYESNGECDCSS